MSLTVTVITFAAGLLIGVFLSTLFWWKRINQLHMWWQAHFSGVVQATVAYYLGGHLGEDGMIHFPHGSEEVPPKEGLN